MSVAAVGVVAAAEQRADPSFWWLIGAGMFGASGVAVLAKLEFGRATHYALALGSASVAIVSAGLFGASIAPAVAVMSPFVVLAAAALGGAAGIVVADGIVLLWAALLGLSAGGFVAFGPPLSFGPERALLTLGAAALVLNVVAMASQWLRPIAEAEAEVRVDRLRGERDTALRELEQLQSLASVGRLVAHVAHEVSNPIQALDNMLFVLLEQTPESDARRRFLVMMKDGVQRITHYVDQLSEFYRPTEATTAADINRTIGDVFRFLERQLENADIKVSQDLRADRTEVMIAEDRLRQILLNVVLNAVEAMPDGGELLVSSETREDDVLAIFQDSGPGFPADNLQAVFEPFFTTKEAQGGTGLGLSISQRLARSHGGELIAENTPTGARLIVRIPAAANASGATS